MPIVSDGQLNLAALQVDDLYLVIIPPQTPLIPGFPTDGAAVVGASIKGPLNSPLVASTPQDVIRQFGDITTHPNDLVTEALGALKQGATNLWLSRVSDGTHQTATGAGIDGAGVASSDQLVLFSASSPGSWANDIATGTNTGGGSVNPAGGARIIVDVGSALPPLLVGSPAAGTQTATIGHTGGAWTAGSTVTLTIGGVAYVYTVTASDVAAGAASSPAVDNAIAASITAAINAGTGSFTALRFTLSATVASAIITLTTRMKGWLANVLTITGASANPTGNVTVGAGTFANGVGASGSSALATTLNGSLAQAGATVTVFSTAGFPTTGLLLIESEIIAYTSTSPTTFTGLTRGQFGTSAPTSHPSGAAVSLAGAAQTYKVTVTSAYDPTEVFDNLVGTSGPATAVGTLAATIVNVLNNGVTGIRGPSGIVTAAGVGSSNNIMGCQLVQLGSANVGADGRGSVAAPGATPVVGVPSWTNTITTAALIGNDGVQSRTGMYALRGLPIFQFGLAGCVDPASWALQVAFATSESLLAVLGVAQGTSSQTAVSNKLGAAVDDYHFVMVKDFLFLNDTANKLIRLVSPIGATLGRIAALSPERSPGNKPILGYLGTERTGYVSAGGAFKPGAPYSNAEIALLEQNGIMFMTQPAVGGNYLSLRHGQNGSSDPTRNGVNYSRMVLFIARSLSASPGNTNGPLGFVVNEVHTAALRRRVVSAISQFLGSLADPGPGRSQMIGDVNGGPAFSVQCDQFNNSNTQVAQGYLNVAIQVKLLSIVRFFVMNVEAGQSVTVRVVQSPIRAQQGAQAAA